MSFTDSLNMQYLYMSKGTETLSKTKLSRKDGNQNQVGYMKIKII